MTYDDALKNCLFRYRSGSHAYGTNNAQSDEDFRGVFMSPLSRAFDLFGSKTVGSGPLGNHLKSARDLMEIGLIDGAREHLRQAMEVDQGDLKFDVETVQKPGCDEEMHELRKFLKLAAACNPNIIEFLYVERGITLSTPFWEKLRANRHLFLSKSARFTFSGYAVAQLRRIQTHRGYLLNPPAAKPTRANFGLPEETVVDKKHSGAILSLPEGYVAPSIRDGIKAEKAYQEAKDSWDSYTKWKKTRNEKRAVLEQKFGYDCKHAMHLVRLIRMAKEIMTQKDVIVYRPDREELLSIRNGEWDYEKIVAMTENIDAELDALYETSDLQAKADLGAIGDLYREIAAEFYGIHLG